VGISSQAGQKGAVGVEDVGERKLPLGAATDGTDGSYGLKRSRTYERNYISPIGPISPIRSSVLSRSAWENRTITHQFHLS
jgi:hypothetical protein